MLFNSQNIDFNLFNNDTVTSKQMNLDEFKNNIRDAYEMKVLKIWQ
jgi:hypothetical protein